MREYERPSDKGWKGNARRDRGKMGCLEKVFAGDVCRLLYWRTEVLVRARWSIVGDVGTMVIFYFFGGYEDE